MGEKSCDNIYTIFVNVTENALWIQTDSPFQFDCVRVSHLEVLAARMQHSEVRITRQLFLWPTSERLGLQNDLLCIHSTTLWYLQIAMDEWFVTIFSVESKSKWFCIWLTNGTDAAWLIVSEFWCTHCYAHVQANKWTNEHKLPAPNEHYRMKYICLLNYRRSSNARRTQYAFAGGNQIHIRNALEMQLKLSGRP